MADAPALGAGVRKGVEVRILSPTQGRAKPARNLPGSAGEDRLRLSEARWGPRLEVLDLNRLDLVCGGEIEDLRIEVELAID
jgi:hypothetical protein